MLVGIGHFIDCIDSVTESMQSMVIIFVVLPIQTVSDIQDGKQQAFTNCVHKLELEVQFVLNSSKHS